MSTLLFSARRQNWSAGPRGARERRYLVYSDGTCEIGPVRKVLAPEAFARLKALLEGDFLRADVHHDAYDGEGWSMTLYDRAGGVARETGWGYIYGVPALEEIVAILRKASRPEAPKADSSGGEQAAPALSPDEICRLVFEKMAREEADRRKKSDPPPDDIWDIPWDQ